MAFHFVADLVPLPKCWRIKVRVIRLWKTPSVLNPDVNASIDMVLCDSSVSLKHFKCCFFFSFSWNLCFANQYVIVMISYLICLFSFLKGSRISVHITKFFFSSFTELLEEGKVFIISNFSLSPNRGSFKTSVHPYRIKFQQKTVVEQVENDPAISLYGFNFIPFSNISTKIHDEDVLVGQFLTLLINFKYYAFYFHVVLTYSLFLNRCHRFAVMQE